MSAAVIVFPGSNCDRDCKVAIERSTGEQVEMIWHQETELPSGLDLIVLPGGFSYGDYLRCGAMAAQSPVMQAVKKAADDGVAVVGIAYKDEPVATRAFLDELGDPYSMVLVDREGRAGLDLGISGVPETFAVDAMGRITAKQSGPLLDDADIDRLVASMQASPRPA